LACQIEVPEIELPNVRRAAQSEGTDWIALRDRRYEPRAPAPDGILRSTIFPGLWLDIAAPLRGDLRAVLCASNWV
jgi:hypothetical protein